MNYKTLKKNFAGVNYIFVTRGDDAPFTSREAELYLEELHKNDKKLEFKVSDSLKRIFMQDMRQFGAQFCANKYGATKEQIIEEAQRLAIGK